MADDVAQTHVHTCPLCEATCGLVLQTRDREVVSVRGDADDVFSAGFACPKGLRIGDLHADPDRLTTPLVDGRPATWDEAWAAIAERFAGIPGEARAIYLGNPNVHNLSGGLYGPAVIRALGTRQVFSASTSDQMPKQVAALLMFGDGLSVPIPDVDRTDLLVVLGADPLTSNGSLMTAPDMPARLRALRARGGRLVVVDPRTSRTARAAAPSAAVYGRLGTCTVRFGTLASWLVDVVNTLTGNLDRPGGVMFPKAAAGQRNSSPVSRPRAPRFGRFATSVRGLPEVMGELPSAALAEEIAAGRIRALVTIAGNPVVSAPDAGRLDAAMAGLQVMVSVDCYLNETTRHADVVLPVPGVLERPHYDLAFTQLSVRNVANWSPPVFAPSVPPEWQTLCRLASVLAGGPASSAAVEAVDARVLDAVLAQHVAHEGSPVHGRDVAELVAQLSAPTPGRPDGRRGEERVLDALLRLGPYGDGFGADPDGLTLDRLAEHPHGLDLGPLQPRIPEVLRTLSGRVELAPEPILADLPRLAAALDEPDAAGGGPLRLVGRRHLRSNNSWGHNVAALVGGSNTCTLLIHPQDAASRALTDGAKATVSSAAGSVVVEVEVTDRIRPGVVSLPHGWGHAVDGVRLGVASTHGGVNSNVLTPPDVDPLSGTAILNGFAVEVAAL